MKAWIESRENWTPLEGLDWVGGGCSLLSKTYSHPACFALASLAFSFACVHGEAVNSLGGRARKGTLARKSLDFVKRPLVFMVEFIY